MDTLPGFIRDRSDARMLAWSDQIEAARLFGVTVAQVEEEALERSILPARYQRNRNTLSVNDQLRLFRSSVAVIGCGGLGGYVVEELARLGVGRIVVIDPDVFEEHNFTFPDPAGKRLGTLYQRVNHLSSGFGVTELLFG